MTSSTKGEKPMIRTQRIRIAGRDHLEVSVTGSATAGEIAQETRAALQAAFARIVAEGFATRHIVRSRLFARNRPLRDVAGQVRLDLMAGELRGASSSYIDPDRLPPDASVQIDLLVLKAAEGSAKRVQEYDPVAAPPMFVTLDGMAYLSGMTSTLAGFPAQLDQIRETIARGLSGSGSGWDKVVRVDAFAAASEPQEDAWAAVAGVYRGFDGPLTLSVVEGFTSATKRVELETTAVI